MPHYWITRNGTILELVPYRYLASRVSGNFAFDSVERDEVETQIPYVDLSFDPASRPTEDQYSALAGLIKHLEETHAINRRRIVSLDILRRCRAYDESGGRPSEDPNPSGFDLRFQWSRLHSLLNE